MTWLQAVRKSDTPPPSPSKWPKTKRCSLFYILLLLELLRYIINKLILPYQVAAGNLEGSKVSKSKLIYFFFFLQVTQSEYFATQKIVVTDDGGDDVRLTDNDGAPTYDKLTTN